MKINGYPILVCLMYAVYIASLLSGQNLISVFGVHINSGMFVFPLTFIFVALITEKYGFLMARSAIIGVCIANLFIALIIFLSLKIPSNEAYTGNSFQYHKFLGRMDFLICVTTFSYFVSEIINSYVLFRLKDKTKNVILRISTSNILSIIIDTWLLFPLFITRHKNFHEAFFETSVMMGFKIIYDICLLPFYWLFSSLYSKYKNNNNVLPESSRQFTSSFYLKDVIKNGH